MLSFQHLDIQVTGPRAAVFRDAIVELLEMELGSALTPQVKAGFQAILNYSAELEKFRNDEGLPDPNSKRAKKIQATKVPENFNEMFLFNAAVMGFHTGIEWMMQNYFKQSTTRLYFIAGKVLELCMEIYQRPRDMVEDISALGLRHVGYGILTEHFPPFVEAWSQAIYARSPVDISATMSNL
eukprot:g27357.t1